MMSQPLSPLLQHTGGYINGGWIKEASSGGIFSVVNPATGETLAHLPELGATETLQAINAAETASEQLRRASVAARRQWLDAIAALLEKHRAELARIITLEQGKPLAEAAVEIDYSIGFFRYYAEHLESLAAPELHPELQGLKGHHWSVHYRPAGIAALITPWNFPFGMLAKKLAAAIAAGCATLTKPAEATPLSPIAFWNLLSGLDLPAGAHNLLIGEAKPIGEILCADPRIRVLSFTGSTAVGKWLYQHSANSMKRLSLELGGNAPCLVFADADLPAAVEAIVANKFRCAGQTCVCINRVYVEAAAHEPFVHLLTQRLRSLRLGSGLEKSTDLGPLINAQAVQRVAALVDDALAKGATRLVGGEPLPVSLAQGTFYPPTLLIGCRSDMGLFQSEIFGPVLALATFPTGDESAALSAANATPYGLAAYCFTGDLQRAERLASGLQFGHLAINSGMGPTPELPFGGFKQSGIGREGGREGFLEFCEPQTIALR